MNHPETNRAELFKRLFGISNRWHQVLYVHTPFCVQKCFYCVYSSKVPSGPDELDRFYTRVFPQQVEQYRSTLEGTAFDQVYFGGGTPTIASADTLEQMYRQIPHFRRIPLKITEASPYTVTPDHLDLFHEYRFDYVSLGVQTLSARILKAQNRKIVARQKLIDICDSLHRGDIISNIDLIFYLDSGGLEDLDQTRRDLEAVMTEIRPISITLHSNYMEVKSRQKQAGMMGVIRESLKAHPEYRCVNALLEEADIDHDMEQAAEYRLMRARPDFHFYMTPKIPQSHAFGHNMLALGAYEQFKPRYSFYYIYDFVDKYALKSMFTRYKSIADEFTTIRNKLSLPHQNYTVKNGFFKDDAAKEHFKQTIRAARLPYYDL